MQRSKFFIQSLGMGLVISGAGPVLAAPVAVNAPPVAASATQESASTPGAPRTGQFNGHDSPASAQGEPAHPRWREMSPEERRALWQSLTPEQKKAIIERRHQREAQRPQAGAQQEDAQQGGAHSPAAQGVRQDVQRARSEVYQHPPRRPAP